MLTEPENSVVVTMRRAAAATHFDEHAIEVARARVRRRRILGASVAGVSAISLCAATITLVGGTQRDNTNVATTAERVNLMVQPRPGNAYPAALVAGTLVVTENNCLALALPTGGLKSSGGERYAIYWAHGFTATRDPEGKAVLYDGKGDAVAREGDIISLGGGLMGESYELPEPSHPCNVGEVWVAAPDVTKGQ